MCLKLNNVDFSIEGKRLFHNLTAEFKRGFNLIYGPSGSGKSSLLKLINMLYLPNGGSITYRENSIASFNPYIWRSRCILTPQKSVFLEGTVMDNLTLPFTFKTHRNKKPDKKLIHELIELFGFEKSLLDATPEGLSGGEAQRIAIIRSVILKPEIFLFDEPTSALDKKMEQTVFSFIKQLSKAHICIICSHSEAAFDFATSIFELYNGSLRNG